MSSSTRTGIHKVQNLFRREPPHQDIVPPRQPFRRPLAHNLVEQLLLLTQQLPPVRSLLSIHLPAENDPSDYGIQLSAIFIRLIVLF